MYKRPNFDVKVRKDAAGRGEKHTVKGSFNNKAVKITKSFTSSNPVL